MSELAFIAPTLFSIIAGIAAWGIKTKMTELFDKVTHIDNRLTKIAVDSAEHRGDLRLEIAGCKSYCDKEFATKPELRTLESRFDAMHPHQ